MPTVTTNQLQALRKAMQNACIHAYIIPTEDAHQSEYIAACDTRRSFISGFTGSAGTAVVTLDKAALWTDGRYYLQASQQLDSNWILQKHGLPKTPSKEDWLLEVLHPSSTVGIDPKLFTVSDANNLKNKLELKGHSLKAVHENLVDQVWTTRPAPPQAPLIVLENKYAGQSFETKIESIQASLTSKNCWGIVVSALDEIAWLFNLRGSDIAFNPVFHSYALLTPTSATLYVDPSKVDQKVRAHLGSKVNVKPYGAIFEDVKALGLVSAVSGQKFWVDQKCSLAILEALGDDTPLHSARSPIQLAKSIKNETELNGFRECHKRDAVALCRYFAWLEDELVHKKNKSISEAAAADKLEAFRAELDLFKGLSFDTISSTGPNGAIIHYKPEHGSCAIIDVDQMYLCDSGGQYLDGTTDCTRTLHFGNPTAEEKEAFTRVLKGHIQLDLAVFPAGTTGYQLDPLARLALWRAGLDFRHGTGHGVGSFLNVHEGPQGISFRLSSNEIPLQEGMTVTNEPGFYKDGAFGIRIENVLLVKKADTAFRFGDVDYLGFEYVTMVPIQTKLIEKSLLTHEEVEWINKYHKICFEKVSPLLKKDEPGYKWLEKETKSI